MSKNTKNAIVVLFGGAGVVVLLIGIFTPAYSFFTGLILAIALWIITAALSTGMGLKNKK